MNSPSETHALAYVRRRILARASLDAESTDEPVTPVGHAFSQAGLWRRHVEGESLTVWLFSCLKFGRSTLPPALDARVVVAGAMASDTANRNEIARKKRTGLALGNNAFKYCFVADANRSVYLPWADASKLFYELEFEPGAKRLPAVLRDTPSLLPRHFQTTRILGPESQRRIIDHADSLLRRPRVFVSYRWQDGTVRAVATAQALDRLGYAVWWDRWGMSRAVAEGRAQVDPDVVERTLARACAGCSHATLIDSPGYGITGWTKWEREHLRRMAAEQRIELLRL